MELFFTLLESLSFLNGSIDSYTTKSKINEYIYNCKENEDRELMLSLLLLKYIAYQDDLYLSLYEKKKITSYFLEHIKSYSKEYTKILHQVQQKNWSIEEIQNYISYNNIKVELIKESLHHLETKIFVDDKYKKVFNSLKTELSIDEKYLRKMLTITN